MKIQIDITTDVEKIIYMCELHIWEDWQITSRINMKRLNTGQTAIIRSNGHFEPDDPRNRLYQTMDRILAADTSTEFVRGQKLIPIDITFSGNPGVTVCSIIGSLS